MKLSLPAAVLLGLTFAGALIAAAIVHAPPGHSALMACIDAGLGAMRIDAPGARTDVEVPFTLP